MKYHINPETGAVGACRAKVRCRFGGTTGQENHFSSKAEAERAAEKQLHNAHVMPALKKPTTNVDKKFEARAESIVRSLRAAGLISSVDDLPAVKSEQELIQKWFAGDEKKYAVVSRMAANDELKNVTRKSVGKFLNQNLQVSMVDSILFDEQKPEEHSSSVDLIDDLPEGKISLADLKSGKLVAFK